jgi:S1-C subfamily serine protease
MKYILRLLIASVSGLAIAGSSALAAPTQHPASAQAGSAQGYLGIVCSDVDGKRAADLKLKEAKGTEIVNVDRDAPAGKAGLRPRDVILQMNGQAITGEQQLRRMLHETPAGHTVTLLVSRDGQQRSVSVQLANRATVEQDAWSQHVVMPTQGDASDAFWGESSLHSIGSGLFSVFAVGQPSVGLEMDTLGSQLADYFGVRDGLGLLVKHVSDNSPASRAGIKAGDVITKANGQKIATLSEWMKMLHSNRGKLIQLTLIRNRKEQTATLEAGGKKNHSQLLRPEGFAAIDNPGFSGGPDRAVLEALRAQAEAQGEWMAAQMRQMEAEIEMLSAAPGN